MQEAAVVPDYFRGRIAGEDCEGVGCVDDRQVRHVVVAEHQGGAAVDVAKLQAGVRPLVDADLGGRC